MGRVIRKFLNYLSLFVFCFILGHIYGVQSKLKDPGNLNIEIGFSTKSPSHTQRSKMNMFEAREFVKKHFRRMNWLGPAPYFEQFIDIYAISVMNNSELSQQFERAKYAKISNVYVDSLKKMKLSPDEGPNLTSTIYGVPVSISQRIGPIDKDLLHVAYRSKKSREIFEVRAYSRNRLYLLDRYFGDLTNVYFDEKPIFQKVSNFLQTMTVKGERILRLEIIHNHPVEAVEFFDSNKKSIGTYYNPFSPSDMNTAKTFAKAFPKLKIESAILIGMRKGFHFRVSQFLN